jgi:hypothetical protein
MKMDVYRMLRKHIIFENDQLSVMIDESIELLSVLQVLSDFYLSQDTILNCNIIYKKRIEEYYKDYKNHAVIKYFDRLCNYNFELDKPVNYFVTLDESCKFNPDVLPEYLKWAISLLKSGETKKLYKLSQLIKIFMLNTGFDEFIKLNNVYYQSIGKTFIEAKKNNNYISEINDYVGLDGNKCKIILSPLYNESYGPMIKKDVGYSFLCVLGTNFYNRAKIDNIILQQEYMIWHELLHSMVNPVTYLFNKEIRKSSKLFRKVNVNIKKHYQVWSVYLNETIIRAITIRLTTKKYGDTKGGQLAEYEKNAGFVFVDLIASFFYEIELDNKLVSLSDAIKNLIVYLKSQKDK